MPGASIEMDLTTVSAIMDILEMDLPAQVKRLWCFETAILTLKQTVEHDNNSN
jgi:hypothetical protein